MIKWLRWVCGGLLISKEAFNSRPHEFAGDRLDAHWQRGNSSFRVARVLRKEPKHFIDYR
jgi:hypothetical protein